MKKILLSLFVFNFFIFTPVTLVKADTVVRSGDDVSIATEQKIEGDFYSAAGKVNISGAIEEDALLAGGQVTINGTVGADALIFGGNVDIHGTIGDDLRIVAGEVTIAEPVMGDVFVVGGTVSILSTASISGDLILLAGQVTVEGSVGGDVIGTVENLRIDGTVEGDVDVNVTQLTLGDRAQVLGSVKYVSSQLATQALNASVGGEMVRNDPVLPVKNATLSSALTPLLILLFASLAWFLVSRRTLNMVAKRALIVSPRPVVLGIVTLFFAPIGITILMVSMIGGLAGIAGVFAYLLLLSLSFIAMSAVIGLLLMKTFNQSSAQVSLLALIVGVIGICALLMLPFIGPVVIISFVIITLGAMVDLLIRPNVQ